MKSLIMLVSGLIFLASCSSTQLPPGATPDKPLTKAGRGKNAKVPTAAEIADNYTLLQLDAATTALRSISDEAGKTPDKDTGTEIIGCPITGRRALAMTMSLKMLIDTRLGPERDAYSLKPSEYGSVHGFENCASNCTCGVLHSVIQGVDPEGLKPADRKFHERWVTRLNLKATHQDERMTRACATHQQWFCDSDLKAYLEAQTLD